MACHVSDAICTGSNKWAMRVTSQGVAIEDLSATTRVVPAGKVLSLLA